MTGKINNAQNSTVIQKKEKSTKTLKNTHALSTQAVSHGHPE